jgi:hypothetical protein
MSKLIPIEENSEVVGYLFDCPGCKMAHAPYIRPHKNPSGASWDFNGSLDSPTFTPSILTRVDFSNGKFPRICHSFVRDGKIQFLSDCTHSLAGQTVEMLDL